VTRAVLITGATGTLGTAVTRRFLELGHDVVAASSGRSGRAPGQSRDESSGRLHLLQADVTEPDSVSTLVAEAVEALGTIDVLVHLVGGWVGGKPIQDHSPDEWDRVLDLNLGSAFLCSRAVIPHMREHGWGRIVLVSARAARQGREGEGAYAVAKSGVSILAETIAEENRDKDVTANVVAPAALDTPANRAAQPNSDHADLVPPDVVAEMIAFLASEEAGLLRGAWLPAFGRT
jgi:NAD(P)-dependent dehydrogenase (short-subunit alcohol dehydrogenase family)